MIVDKVEISANNFGPDIPSGLDYATASLNADGLTYTLTFTEAQLKARRISAVQGKVLLDERGMIGYVEAVIAQGTSKMKIYYRESSFWDKTDTVIIQMGAALEAQFTGFDFNQFWIDAKLVKP